MHRELKKTEWTGRPTPKRSPEMWFRDLCASLQVLSDSPEVQRIRVDDWQIRSSEIILRFQYEWQEFTRLHSTPLPLNVAERLDWIAQLLTRLSPNCAWDHVDWKEIRVVAADVLKTIRTNRLG
jgi:hypothetical protein